MSSPTQSIAARIDLGQWRGSPENRVISGQDAGLAARKAARLEVLDKHSEKVIVNVPSDLFAVTSSFFLGMFTASIRLLGAERFREHYEFRGKDLSAVREEVIREALRKEVALSQPSMKK